MSIYNKQDIQIKWTLFTQNHWQLSEMVQHLIPEYYHRSMKDIRWSENLSALEKPAHFKNLFKLTKSTHQLNLKEITDHKKYLAQWNLLLTYFQHLESLLALLPINFQDHILNTYKPDQLKAFLEPVGKRVFAYHKQNFIPHTNSLLIVSLTQLAAANHSLSFVLIFRFIHNELCLKALSYFKSDKLAAKLQMEENNFDFERIFQLPSYFELSYEDLLQAIRMSDTCHLLVSKSMGEDKIIAKPVQAYGINLDC